MFRRPIAIASLLVLVATAACSGLKDALTAHVDVAAQAGSQQLSSTQLAEMMQAANMPPRRDLAAAVASLWVNYQLLAQAAGRGDTLGDPALADEAMWAQVTQRRLQKLQMEMAKTFAEPTSADLAKAYDAGELFVARHILFMANPATMSAKDIEAARVLAENVRKQVTPANFVSMVKRYSGDPGSKDAGGEYVFPAGQMVPEFEEGTRALKPGEISPPIKTSYGYHIILRETYDEAKAKFDSAYADVARQKAESTWLADLEKARNVKVKDGAAATMKAIATDVEKYRENRTVLATARGADLRASRVAAWLSAFPPQMRIRQQLQQAPDSVLPDFIRSLMRNELLLDIADSAKIDLDSTERAQVRNAFRGSVQNTMGGLGILPAQLGDSASSPGARATLATTRVTEYFGRLLKNEVQFIDVAEPVALALRKRYDGRVNSAGLDRAVTLATELKAKADSAANAALPPTEVPMPGAPGGAPAGAAAPPSGGKTP